MELLYYTGIKSLMTQPLTKLLLSISEITLSSKAFTIDMKFWLECSSYAVKTLN